MKKTYIVKVDVSYVKMRFKFDTMTGACNFMEQFLDHIDADKEAEVSMVRTCEEEEK